MKRIVAMILLMALLLCGCVDKMREPVTFYYVRDSFEEDMSQVIGTEQREASGHRDDLLYLLALYLMGPAEDSLVSPLPSYTTILSAEQIDSTVTLQLTDTTASLSDGQYTLACSCLTLTCLEITDAEYVTIISGNRSVTLGKDSLVLLDLTTGAGTEEIQ